MRQRIDKLKARCEALLDPGEEILLEAEAGGFMPPGKVLGGGRAYLTDRRLLWIRRMTPLIRPLLFWIPDIIDVRFRTITKARFTRQFPRRAWLRIATDERDFAYAFRLGKGPFPFLRDNPATTEQWFEEIESRRKGSD